jgi:hypothetical protein
MGKPVIFLLAIWLEIFICANAISFENSAYQDVVVEIGENIPTQNCREILENLEVGFFDLLYFENRYRFIGSGFFQKFFAKVFFFYKKVSRQFSMIFSAEKFSRIFFIGISRKIIG